MIRKRCLAFQSASSGKSLIQRQNYAFAKKISTTVNVIKSITRRWEHAKIFVTLISNGCAKKINVGHLGYQLVTIAANIIKGCLCKQINARICATNQLLDTIGHYMSVLKSVAISNAHVLKFTTI
jgi:selenophosphate synthase